MRASARGVSLLQLMLFSVFGAAITIVIIRHAIAEIRESSFDNNVTHAEAISRALDFAALRVTATAVDAATTVHSYTRTTTNPINMAALRTALDMPAGMLKDSPDAPAVGPFLWGATGSRVFWHVPQAFLQTRAQFFQGIGADIGSRFQVEACGLLPDTDGDGATDPWALGAAQCRVSITLSGKRSPGEVASSRIMAVKRGLYGECVQAAACTPIPLTTPP